MLYKTQELINLCILVWLLSAAQQTIL